MGMIIRSVEHIGDAIAFCCTAKKTAHILPGRLNYSLKIRKYSTGNAGVDKCCEGARQGFDLFVPETFITQDGKIFYL
jgi:hypothetical protein